jgi:High potential iron-sulfur protein
MPTRRSFVQIVPFAGFTLLGGRAAHAAEVEPGEPQAVALGYVTDATKADKAKYPQYAAGQECANCMQYQGKSGDAQGGCTLFGGRNVAAKGWCSAWVKKG